METALVTPDFYRELGALPAIEEPVVLRCERDGDRVELRVRYRFRASLPSSARRLIDVDRLTWIDETVVDLATHRATFSIVPEHYGDRFSAHGVYTLVDDSDATRQQMAGEVAVRLPLIAGRAERGIVRGLGENLEHEARLLERWIAGRAG